MRYLAIDFGLRRIGLAVSDETETFASPLTTRERQSKRHDIAAIIETLRGVGAERIVMGLPRALTANDNTTIQNAASQNATSNSPASDNPPTGTNSARGSSEAAARQFAQDLQKGLRAAGLPDEIEWWDERFSTREALTQMRAAGVSQRQGRAATGSGSVDARAAAIILQGFLDFRRAQAQRAATSIGDIHTIDEAPALSNLAHGNEEPDRTEERDLF